ncbi:MAG: type 1 glutamine amidotransferase [Pseudomonadota bacterium]
MHIGILQAGHWPDALIPSQGNYSSFYIRMLSPFGFTFDSYPVVDMVLPGSIHAADGWLISGSRHGAYEDHAWIPPLEAFIRDCYGAGVPMVGICFGHQIIAQALGGTVEKFAGGWSVGQQRYDFGTRGTLASYAWHQDQVTALPEGAERIGQSDFCANAALLYEGRAFTVQPHPEYEPAQVEGLLEHRAPGVVPPDQIEAAWGRMDQPVDNAAMAGMIATFFKERRLE